MRHLLQPDADPRLLSSDEVRAVADLCVNCKMCARECPARVNVPKLMLEAKAANVAEHGLDRTDWAMARTEAFARLGQRLRSAGQRHARPIRWPAGCWKSCSACRAAGACRAFASRSFLRQAHRRGWTRRPRSARPRVAYFVDMFANYNDPLIAEAVVAVLHHNGIEVYVPPRQGGCGMAPLAYGDVETARETVQDNLLVLADLAREGYPILCSEPTAAVMLRHDALDLLDDADARLVAAQTVESTAFLVGPAPARQPAHGFRRRCRSPSAIMCRAISRRWAGRRWAGTAVVDPGAARAYDRRELLGHGRHVRSEGGELRNLAGGGPADAGGAATGRTCLFGSTECSTCRMQMEDGGGNRTLHPAQYLALAYGYLPELRERLRQPIGNLVLR